MPVTSNADLGPDQLVSQLLADDGTFPNNGTLPLLLYRDVSPLTVGEPSAVEDLFESNSWGGSWRNGIYAVHHYHSTAHEVLGVYGGSATVRLGGERGVSLTVYRGDVVIIPAGVAHKNLGSSADFRVVGAYPRGQKPDMCFGKADERPRADSRISAVPLPEGDPVFGTAGPLTIHWKFSA